MKKNILILVMLLALLYAARCFMYLQQKYLVRLAMGRSDEPYFMHQGQCWVK